MRNLNDSELDNFLSSLTNSQIYVVLEAARLSLADAEIAFDVGFDMSMSDADINHLQHKVHMFMKGDNAQTSH